MYALIFKFLYKNKGVVAFIKNGNGQDKFFMAMAKNWYIFFINKY
jgi:hypothetical protein